MRLAALVSGGKDSIYAIYAARKEGHTIECILTMMSGRADSYMFHHPNASLTEVQAKLMGIPLIRGKTEGIKEEELKDLKKLIGSVKGKVEGIVTGALASNYQKSRIDAICKGLDLESLAPLWHRDPENYLNELLDNNFKVMITAVAAEGLDQSWLGRILDKKAIEDLKKLNKRCGLHMAFEGGEAETLVLDCPLFSKEMVVKKASLEWDGIRGTYTIESYELKSKPSH